MNIALLGFGTVGQGVWKLLQERKDLLDQALGEPMNIVGIGVRTLGKKRAVSAPEELFTTDAETLVSREDVDCLVEVTGDQEMASRLMKQALLSGKSVVTANKAAVAADFEELSRAAQDGGASFRFEAAVCGGIPIVAPLIAQAALNEIETIRGIVNGSSNYVLTELAKGKALEEVLGEARRLGVLEADPTDDLAGYDAQRKIAILASLVSGHALSLDQIPCLGIETLDAQDMAWMRSAHRMIRLIASFEGHGGRQSAFVCPVALPESDGLALVQGLDNQVEVQGSRVGHLVFRGPGAGMDPTANAVWTDLLSVSRSRWSPAVHSASEAGGELSAKEEPDASEAEWYYVRLRTAEESDPWSDLRSSLSANVPDGETMEKLGALPDHAGFMRLSLREAEMLYQRGAVVLKWGM